MTAEELREYLRATPSLQAAYVAEHGEPFEPAPLPRPYPYRRWRAASACYRNAAKLAIEHRNLTYVEGFGTLPGFGTAAQHAWTVEPDGRVVDPIWRDAYAEGVVYLGVRFGLADVRRSMRSGYWGSVIELLLADG